MAEEYDILQDRAAFAQKFIGTTNLDQRQRFAEDIKRAKEATDKRRKQEFEELQQRDPRLMDAVTKRMEERRLMEADVAKRTIAERKFQWDQEKASRMEALSAKKLELQMRSEERALAKEAREIEKMEKMESDMEAIDEGELVLREQFTPGTEEYKRGMMDLLIRHKNLDKDYRRTVLEQVGYTNPEEAYEAAANFTAQNPGSRATGVPLLGGSRGTLVSPESEAPKTPTVDLKRLDKLKADVAKERAKGKRANPEIIGYLDNEIAAIDTQRTPVPGQATANFTDSKSFTEAYQKAASGAVLIYNGRPWRKP